jgi:hypothetical protein
MTKQHRSRWHWDAKSATIALILLAAGAFYCLGGMDTFLFKAGIHANFYQCYQNTVTGYTLCCGPLASGHGSDICRGA